LDNGHRNNFLSRRSLAPVSTVVERRRQQINSLSSAISTTQTSNSILHISMEILIAEALNFSW
jgi:hypothetical protein